MKKYILLCFILCYSSSITKASDSCLYYKDFDFLEFKAFNEINKNDVKKYTSQLQLPDSSSKYYDLFSVFYKNGKIDIVKYSIYTLTRTVDDRYILSLGDYRMVDSMIIEFSPKNIVTTIYQKDYNNKFCLKGKVYHSNIYCISKQIYFESCSNRPSTYIEGHYLFDNKSNEVVFDKELEVETHQIQWNRVPARLVSKLNNDSIKPLSKKEVEVFSKDYFVKGEDLGISYTINPFYKYHFFFSTHFLILPVGVYEPILLKTKVSGISLNSSNFLHRTQNPVLITDYYDVDCKIGLGNINNIKDLIQILYLYTKD